MSEHRNQYGYPVAAPAPCRSAPCDHLPIGLDILVRTVADLRRALEGLPGEWPLTGPGTDNVLRIEILPGSQVRQPQVYLTSGEIDASGRWL